jgi:ferredoxin
MPKLWIDGTEVQVDRGATLLQAAQKLGIVVPTLCSLDGLEHFTSCMLCVVEETATGKLLPACSAPAAEGMRVETANHSVRAARRAALELLLAEHVGDCDAPCTLACPVGIDIPLVIRQLREGRTHEALCTIREATAFPALLCRICPAPCESACRRGKYDEAVAIRQLIHFLAGTESPSESPGIPPAEAPAGNIVAVIGAGAAGLSAAYHLSLLGYDCTVFEAGDTLGGSLQQEVLEDSLPHSIFNRDLEILKSMGIRFLLNSRVGEAIAFGEIVDSHDAAVFAAGEGAPDLIVGSTIRIADGVPRYRTSTAKVFAAGSVLKPECSVVEAMAHGRAAAACVDQYLKGQVVTGPLKRFQSRIGRLQEGEILEFLRSSADIPRRAPAAGLAVGYNREAAAAEAIRCFQCDCGKKESCRLRAYAEEFGVRRRSFRIGVRRRFERILQHPTVIFEPGKCIKCGICVRITAAENEKLGLTFLNRGYDLRIGVPFGDLLSQALKTSAERCVRSCPTGALCFRQTFDEQPEIQRNET